MCKPLACTELHHDQSGRNGACYLLLTTYYLLLATLYPTLAPTYYLLLTTYYLRPTTYYLLSTSTIYYLLPSIPGADVLARIVKENGIQPFNVVGAGGDSTGHAGSGRVGQRGRFKVMMEAQGARSIILVGCARHFKELEIKAAKTAAFGKLGQLKYKV